MNKYNIIKLTDVVSTNTYVLSLKSNDIFKEGLVVVSDYQHKGRGQRGSVWESEAGKNLIISILIEPNISIDRQFDIIKITTISVLDLLCEIGVRAKIKWPNDILIGDSKVAGVLIDNRISSGIVAYSVMGIGLNVNQVLFNDYSPKATSLKVELNKDFSLEIIMDKLLKNLQKRIADYRLGNNLDSEYLDALFQKDMLSTFESCSQIFTGIIRGVNDRGMLVIESDRAIKTFDLNEVRMIF